ncbi:hypothetical protein LTS15_007387 [Exophiala xenobiotica]|nr:hypothetical protein LTS15_007387 [Exophiala xenobiotica]
MALPMPATKLTPTPARQRQSLEPTPFIPSSSPLTEKSYCSGGGSPAHVVHTDSTKRYTFTPQRVKSLPRAWERRPATPYVPRNDAQKIWKRMPLGEVMTNFGEQWQQKVAGAGGANTNTNGRSVKRLRVGGRQDQNDQEEDDKENMIEYVPSKWDDAAAVGSPKRKSVGVGFVAVNANAATLKPGSECAGGVQEGGFATPSPPDGIVTVRQATEEEVCSPNTVEGSELETEVAERSQDVSDGVKMPGQGEEKDQTFTLESDPEPSPSGATPSEALLESALQPANPNPPEHEAGPASSTRQSNNQLATITIPADQDDTAYLHDFLSRARAQKAAKQQQAIPQEQEVAAAPMDGIETTIATATSPESPPAACHIEDVSVSESTSTSARAVSLSQDEPRTSTPSLEQPDQEQTDTTMTSPRRSSRLITRIPLPRPQKSLAILPSNIALKRLNGTEFIAMQRETQSLALTTRTNTKRNKGDAVGVQHKLVQLSAEEKAGNGYGNGQGPTTEVPAKKGSKRKKKAKVVSWDSTLARYEGGEEAVRVVSPDGEEVEAEPAEQEDEDATTPVEAERDGKENDDGQEREREKNGNENQNGEKVPRELEEKNQVRKVRRLRKLNVGNVNGTPAPKRRISLGIPVPVGSTSSSSSTAEQREDKEYVNPSASEGGRQSSGGEQRMRTRTQTSTSTRRA